MSHFIIFDTEYTTWDGAQDRDWAGENEYREIVQIGALKISRDDFSVIEEFNVLVKPKRNPHLSDFFLQLTHLRQQDVDEKGVTFIDALDAFSTFCGAALIFSYGADSVIMGENIALHESYGRKSSVRHHGMNFVNIGPYFHRAAPESRAYNSGRLWHYFDLPKPHEADEHDALFDCYSILAAMRHLIACGETLPL